MSTLNPQQLARRDRIEAVIRLLAPGLDLLLAAGDRVARLAERDDPDYVPARPIARAQEPRAVEARTGAGRE